MEKLIEVENMSFGYERELILEKINFSICKGDFLALIGSNGAGKSTLLKLLLGELTPSVGAIRLLGKDVRHFQDWPKIGYVPQNVISSSGGFPATAAEVVMANLFSQIGLFRFPKKEHRKKMNDALEMVDMGDYADRLIGNLSGGQQQRVMLARVLVNDPKVMLLDEPTTGVDTKNARSLYELLARLNREIGLTIVMVTHDIMRAFEFVSRTLCLEQGSVVELDRNQVSDELSHKHKHPSRGG